MVSGKRTKLNRKLSQQQKQVQINVPLNQLNDIACICGNKLFIQVIAIKKLPAIYSPDGKEGSLNAPAGMACFVCGKLGEVKEVTPPQPEEKGGDGNGQEGIIVP